MKFNPNCVRDILLECERVLKPNVEVYIEETDIPDFLSKYSWSELLYHLKQCELSELFAENSREDIIGGYTVTDISPNGHELLAKIHNDKVWEKLLKKGIQSLPQLIEVAANTVSLLRLFNGNNLGNGNI